MIHKKGCTLFSYTKQIHQQIKTHPDKYRCISKLNQTLQNGTNTKNVHSNAMKISEVIFFRTVSRNSWHNKKILIHKNKNISKIIKKIYKKGKL